MSKFIQNNEYLRIGLIFCLYLKKFTVESNRLLREALGEHAPSQDTCERWFRRSKISDFKIADKEHEKPFKKFEGVDSQALLDENDSQTQKQPAEQLDVSQQTDRLQEMGRFTRPVEKYHKS